MEKICLIRNVCASTSNNIKNITKVLLNFVSISFSNVQPRKNTCKSKKEAQRIPNLKK